MAKWNYKSGEFIKLNRKILNWKWYKNTNTKVVFIHCLLRANWKAGEWHGIKYEAGEFITSLATLAEETGLSVQNVRTALKHLIDTGEIISTPTSEKLTKFLTKKSTKNLTKQLTKHRDTTNRVITVVSWGDYQTANKATNKVSNKVSNKDSNNSIRIYREESFGKNETEEAASLTPLEEVRRAFERNEPIDWSKYEDEDGYMSYDIANFRYQVVKDFGEGEADDG